MTGTLGVDIGALNSAEPFVVTASMPEARLRSGLAGQRYQVRQQWDKRAGRGEVPDEEQPSDGPTSWNLLILGLAAGAATAVVLGALVQVIISGIGWMAGAHPGPYGWLTGVAAGVLTGFVAAMRQEETWVRDAAFLAANQRTIVHPGDRADMGKAASSALAVQENLPQIRSYLPDTDQKVQDRLHAALWEVADALLERRKVADALAGARAAAIRVPPGTASAHDLAAQKSHAEALQRQWDAAAGVRIAHLSALGEQSRLFVSERDAIIHAREVASSMVAALGTPGRGSQPYPEAARELGSRIATLQAAYLDVCEDITGGN
jgi:hypothetical protein